MNIILFDGPEHLDLLPFTYTRPTAAIRCGIYTSAERWSFIFSENVSYLTQPHLSKKYEFVVADQNLLINGSFIPDLVLIEEVKILKINEALYSGKNLIAVCCDQKSAQSFELATFEPIKKIQTQSTLLCHFAKLWHLFTFNDQAIRLDYHLITSNRKGQDISVGNTLIDSQNIFVEAGAKVQGAYLNASTGPIYIGKNAEVMEGTFIRGPFALCDHAATKIGAKVYGATTIGPHCKVGGEVNNIIMFGYSNKGHDGFMGNAVIGEWCNIGADSNCSNLKNNYADVKIWSHPQNKFEKTGLTFCGLMMADHAKCGINTMFNTATVIGVAANVFGAGFPRNFVPAFAWGGAHGFETFQLSKAFDMAIQMSKRRGIDFNEQDQAILAHVFESTKDQRVWDL